MPLTFARAACGWLTLRGRRLPRAPSEYESPLQAVHPYRAAKEPVVLYEGDIDVAGIGKRPGRVELSSTSAPRIHWRIESREQDGLITKLGEVAVTVRRGRREFVVNGHQASGDDGWINAAQLGGADHVPQLALRP